MTESTCKRACKVRHPCMLLCLQVLLGCMVRGQQTALQVQVVENSATNSVVGRVYGDSPSNRLNYSFSGVLAERCNTYFNINFISSVITVRDQATLDREAIGNILHCFVGFKEVLNNTATATRHVIVDIEVLDVNDCIPHFSGLSQPEQKSIPENVALPNTVLLLQPTDDDKGMNGTTQFSITRGNDGQYFNITLAEGDTAGSTTDRILVLIRPLDFESLSNGGVFNLTITIRDMGPQPLIFEQIVIIRVVDLDDEPPIFVMTSYMFNVTENYPVGNQAEFVHVQALSNQAGGQIIYEICDCPNNFPNDVTRIVGINNDTGGLFLKVPVDFESYTDPRFVFTVEASNPNAGAPATTIVTVDIIDVNEYPPYFTCRAMKLDCPGGVGVINVNNSVLSIEENFNFPNLLFSLRTADDDPAAKFQLINRDTIGHHIEPDTGPLTAMLRSFGDIFNFIDVRINDSLDREQTPNFTLILTVENVLSPTLRSDFIISITVLDVNDNSPTFLEGPYKGYVFEGSPMGMEILRVQAQDPDQGENGTITYSICVREEVARDWFQISPVSGMISVQSPSLNYISVEGTVTLNVTVSDNGTDPLTSSMEVVISIFPSTTFISGSYQEYSSVDFSLLTETNTSFYFEFRSSERNGLLAYQQDLTGGIFSVELQNGGVAARSGSSTSMYNDTDVSTDTWHSVYVQRSNNQVTGLTVAEMETTANSGLALLQEVTIQRCVNRSQQQINHQNSLYIGGVNLLRLPSNNTLQIPFVGGIRNVVVGAIQLDPTCPAAEVNTARGVARSYGCAQMQCSSNRTSQCVDYATVSYCRCLGGFSSQACNITDTRMETQSYAPIRFRGSTRVSLNLGYSFFYDLQVRKSALSVAPGGANTGPATGTGVGTGPARRRRDVRGRRNTVGVASAETQVVEVWFRLVDVRSAVLLHSRSSSSVHLIWVQHRAEGHTSLKYTIWNSEQTQTPVINLTIDNFPFQTQTEYRLRATTGPDTVSLDLSGTHVQDGWGSNPGTPFAEQPQTDISIGGASNTLINTTGLNLGYFMGCIIHMSIDGIELPLSGLLTAASEGGGFQVEGSNRVDSYCNLCDLTICPDKSTCQSDRFGAAACQCHGNLTLTTDGRSCVLPTTPPTPPGLASSAEPLTSMVSYIAGGAGAGVLVVLGIIIIIIIAVVRRKQERRKRSRSYSITSIPNGSATRSKTSNPYTPTNPKRRPSFTTPLPNGNCTDTRERGSSVSTYQEHDGEPETPTRHPPTRKRHTSVESGIKMDTDHETSIGRGIPQMDDSGHEVNSTDSVRSMESEDVASSCCNEQLPSRPSISLRMMGALSSPDQRSPRSPLTPLTLKEQKIMIPIRPASTNLSQSEFGDEATDVETESFNTRVSSSSGVGGSMQNQGRGSDSENSKSTSGCSTPQWYKSSTTSDTERENERIQASRPYYPLRLAQPEGRQGNGRNYQPTLKTGPHPPVYYSPPTFPDHINGGYFRPRTKSLHTTTKSPLANTPKKYENYPHIFTSDGMRKGRLAYEQRHHGPEPSYNSHPCHDRQLSDPRALNEQGCTPTLSITRQYSDPRIPQNGNYCIPRKHSDDEPQPIHIQQTSNPRMFSQQTHDSIFMPPRSSRSLRHIASPASPGAYSNKRPAHSSGQRPYYTLGRMVPNHTHYTANQPGHGFTSGNAAQNEELFQTLTGIAKIDPISNYEAQDRMKTAVDHMDPLAYHLLSGPCMQFEDVSTDPSVIESQLTMDESMMEEPVFESQGGGEGTAVMLDPLDDIRLARLREDELDSILTDSEIGRDEMNHFPSADCSSQYTATIVAGSTSTSGESTPKLQKVFVIPSSQQSFDV